MSVGPSEARTGARVGPGARGRRRSRWRASDPCPSARWLVGRGGPGEDAVVARLPRRRSRRRAGRAPRAARANSGAQLGGRQPGLEVVEQRVVGVVDAAKHSTSGGELDVAAQRAAERREVVGLARLLQACRPSASARSGRRRARLGRGATPRSRGGPQRTGRARSARGLAGGPRLERVEQPADARDGQALRG